MNCPHFHLNKANKITNKIIDKALFPKLMELKWSVAEYKDVLIPCLGVLHIAMNLLGVIGRHMNKSGLCDLWVECDLLGANAAQHVMDRKGYARAMRTHKLTLQALLQVLLPRFYTYLDDIDDTLRAEVSDSCTSIDVDSITQMVETLSTERFRQPMTEFTEALAVDDPNAEFWWQYKTTVSIPLSFTQAQRDGLWDLHLYSFKRMLPCTSSGMIMSTTPDGVLCIWLICRLSHQKSSWTFRKATS